MKQISESLKKQGWYTSHIEVELLDELMTRIANNLGKPVKSRQSTEILQCLSPVDSNSAFPNSLSFKHKTASFPMHADTAHWPIPCRYLILGCHKAGGDRKTLLLDSKILKLSRIEKDILYNQPFRISNGRNSFYSTILSHNRGFIRYDQGCMSSVEDQDKIVSHVFSVERNKNIIQPISWRAGKYVIIDNWRMLHARGNTNQNDNNRLLKRVLIHDA